MIKAIVAIVLLVVMFIIGMKFPICTTKTAWIYIVMAYLFLASVMPMWLLMQPRDYMTTFMLLGMIIGAVVGVIVAHPSMQLNAFSGFNVGGSSLFPTLFVTIACGAVSGFHSLVSSGTSSKTISSEKDMPMVGYGAMVVESLLGIVSLVVVGAVAVNGTKPDGTPFSIFSSGVAGFLEKLGVPVTVATVFMTMCVSALALTSLDSVARIGRMSFQELFYGDSTDPADMTPVQRVLTNKYFATVITHKSNAELIGQGLGNIFSGLFGGIPATGAIARTAANVRNGGRTPIAGIVHCITLTIILLVLMPLAALIPMTTLAAVLLVVAANMADWTSFFRLCKTAPKSDIIVLVATFFLTVFFDLVVAIEIGVVLAALLFMKRMAETADIKAWKYTDSPDITPGEAEKLRDIPHSISVFEICGPMFFAAADQIVNINSHHHTKVVVIRMRSVPAIDASAMHSLHELADRAKRKNITLVFSHVNEQPMHVMEKDGFVELIGKENFHENIVDALDYAEQLVK